LAVRWWQQLCPGWGVATAIHICGHDRQFPQNSAATINVAMRMLEGPPHSDSHGTIIRWCSTSIFQSKDDPEIGFRFQYKMILET
jgi:hypothetical protein